MNSAVHGPPARSIVAAFATALLASACGADPGAAGGVRATRPDPVPSRPSAVGGAGAPHGVASAGGDGPGADEDRRAPTGGRRLDPGASARRGAGAPDPVGHRELPLQFSTQGTSKTPVVLPWTFREVVFVDAIRRPARAERLLACREASELAWLRPGPDVTLDSAGGERAARGGSPWSSMSSPDSMPRRGRRTGSGRQDSKC
jgi:hypothetical protein